MGEFIPMLSDSSTETMDTLAAKGEAGEISAGHRHIDVLGTSYNSLIRQGIASIEFESDMFEWALLSAIAIKGQMNHSTVILVRGELAIITKDCLHERYLKTPFWDAKRNAAFAVASHRCQVCNTPKDGNILDVHHRTYERLGYELPSDLIVLCRGCHTLFHENGRLAKPPT